jgi:hypothetical protein
MAENSFLKDFWVLPDKEKSLCPHENSRFHGTKAETSAVHPNL